MVSEVSFPVQWTTISVGVTSVAIRRKDAGEGFLAIATSCRMSPRTVNIRLARLTPGTFLFVLQSAADPRMRLLARHRRKAYRLGTAGDCRRRRGGVMSDEHKVTIQNSLNSRGPRARVAGPLRLETIAVRAGAEIDADTGALAPPLHLSTTFEHGPASQPIHGFLYARQKNPTQLRLEAALRELEGGLAALTFSSGMAASAA